MTDSHMEEQLRRMLAEQAAGAAPSEPPYGAIVRQGRKARRRFRAGLATAAVVLAAIPGGAFAAQGEWFRDSGSAHAAARHTGFPDGAGVTPVSSPADSGESGGTGPSGPADPERQLLDGITLADATESLERCLDEYPQDVTSEQLRIVLAWVSQGDPNRGEEPLREVLAISDDPGGNFQVVCSDRPEGDLTGVMVSGSDYGTGLPVAPDLNATRFFHPTTGEWRTPFRWADFGLVEPEVRRVTVSYAGSTEEAVLEGQYFLVAGIAEDQPTDPPVVIGYGADGEVLYDSRQDPFYEPGM
ncbi:hypothetical protein [Streptomyces hoynatensis]|uniref:Uncharacterized protein n=1 Tax=Streptomyces hoynatensis TaxID=1141874 RepID=A0A3A9ZER1_9ACTN|nr:hypothetical protein [Streptomyces hoynatensis]RKN46911.1 hypothetical protein D7294_01515 [Streptomyces hoynatensis]